MLENLASAFIDGHGQRVNRALPIERRRRFVHMAEPAQVLHDRLGVVAAIVQAPPVGADKGFCVGRAVVSQQPV